MSYELIVKMVLFSLKCLTNKIRFVRHNILDASGISVPLRHRQGDSTKGCSLEYHTSGSLRTAFNSHIGEGRLGWYKMCFWFCSKPFL